MRKLLARIETDFLPTTGPRWSRWLRGLVAWSVAAPLFLVGAILGLILAAMVTVIVGAVIAGPILERVDLFTVTWTVAGVVALVGVWLYFMSVRESAAVRVGVIAAGLAIVALVGGAWSSEPSGFCATHRCIPNFDEGRGSVVQCADGMWSRSGGLSGACAYHGGVR